MKLPKFKALGLACAVLGCAFSTARADIIEVSSNISSDTRWTRDNVYVVTQIVYVLPPAKLTVEPGTVIRGAKASVTGFTNNPGSIIVTRGAKIIGNATADDPIIFTCLDDPHVPGGVNTIPAFITGQNGVVEVPQQDFSLSGSPGGNAFAYSKECGGLVMLGRTPLGYDRDGDTNNIQWDGNTHSGDNIAYPTVFTTATGNGTGFALIEGLTSTTVTLAEAFDADGEGSVFAPSTTFNLGFFGGVDEDDSSGVIRFWSHRYGGFNIASNNEINGVTMGGVGRGTVMEFQEVAQNADDGFEWFGGYINARYLASVVNGDDCFDGDFGFSGNLQHLFAINDNESYNRSGFGGDSDGTPVGRNSFAVSDKMFEWDGSEPDNSTVTPQTNAYIYSVTLIGNKGANFATPAAQDSAIHILKGASGLFSHGVAEDIGGGGSGDGPLIFIGNASTTPVGTTADVNNFYYFNIGTLQSGAGVANDLTGVSAAASTQLRGKGHLVKNGLDPRLVRDDAPNSVARDLTLALPSRPGVTGFFSPVRYHGAMRDNNWLFGWSWTHAVEMMTTTNVARPRVEISVAGDQVSLSFNADLSDVAAGDAVLYVIERSIDGRAWTPIGTVQDGSAEDEPHLVLADSNGAAGSITVTDADYTYTGSPILYRVIPQ
ncbi:hypothetical protein SAMN02745166_00426 [Prosthecobacter debontii]|uniref:FG-GAP repeat-containing protein n=1 Tax=Prosthecobacter debontii TaxID=48467 RepID=A0A1T4WKY8_9BACT|nr:hypothetical protein [Prosthecobacter debontii]SKA77807.1 hypothetical protein SAMN02745166_00426 [Prosthecobacter debontii]